MVRFTPSALLLATATLVSTLVSTVAAAFSSAPASASSLAVGDAAPDFTLPGTDGNKVTLSSFAGRKNVVLAFFPKAFTGG